MTWCTSFLLSRQRSLSLLKFLARFSSFLSKLPDRLTGCHSTISASSWQKWQSTLGQKPHRVSNATWSASAFTDCLANAAHGLEAAVNCAPDSRNVERETNAVLNAFLERALDNHSPFIHAGLSRMQSSICFLVSDHAVRAQTPGFSTGK